MIAVGAAVADDFIRELLAQLFTAPDSVKCLITAGIAAVFYYCGVQRMAGSPEKVYSNEAILFLGVLSTAGSVAFLGRAIDTGSGHFSLSGRIPNRWLGCISVRLNCKKWGRPASPSK